VLELEWHGRRGGGAPIVFLHEGLGSVSMWRDFPARVAAATGRAALVYSRAGHGRSPPPPRPRGPRFMEEEAAVLGELLDEQGVGEAILFGHSDGASIALIHAGAAPARIRALVLEAPHVFVEELTLRSIEEARAAYRTGDLRRRLARHHDDVDAAFHGWNDVWLDPAFRSLDLVPDVRRVRAPMLLIQGADDPYGSLAQLDRIEGAATVEVRRLVLEGCGHAPHRDRAEEVLAATRELVGS
jgi:pimeloyl-ACP methyl ester carboxylesterase